MGHLAYAGRPEGSGPMHPEFERADNGSGGVGVAVQATLRWSVLRRATDSIPTGRIGARLPPSAREAADRTRVQGRTAVLTQTWADIVWAHWRVPVDEVRRLVPGRLEIDTFDGSAWVGLVPFEMQRLRPVLAGRSLPGIGSTASFSEVNVRTYVTGPDGPGVWFHSLDADSRLAVVVARGLWSLPYRSAVVTGQIDASHRRWAVRRRAGPRGTIGVTVGAACETGPLEAFLTARFRLYAPATANHLLTAPVRHQPWRLRHAQVDELDPGLVLAAGYGPLGRPDHVLAADPVDVTIGLPQLRRS